jgi:acyl carrier protein
MTHDELKALFLTAIATVAPDAQGQGLADDADLRDELELDSMDMLRVLVVLKERLGVEVPEADTPKLFTIGGAVAYLQGRLAG